MSSSGKEETAGSPVTLLEATPEMCYYCFEVLEHEHAKQLQQLDYDGGSASPSSSSGQKRKNAPEAPSPDFYHIPDYECPLFVGWKKDYSKDGEGKLRGCKGTHGSLPLHEGLREYSYLSAFDDSRFSPIRPDEVPRLACSVNLLFAFEKAKHCYDWEVGVHGVRIDFKDRRGIHRSATFLPSVAPQFGYDTRETIERLIEKSGCDDVLDKELEKRIKTVRFQASLCNAEYQDYLNYKKNKRKEK
ncbi:AMME chromosomal region protein 1-like [Balamuthia mandrillaris]